MATRGAARKSSAVPAPDKAGGLVLFFVLLALMAGVAGSAAKRAYAAYAEGAGEAEAAPHERRYLAVLRSGSVIVSGVVWLMVVKPF